MAFPKSLFKAVGKAAKAIGKGAAAVGKAALKVGKVAVPIAASIVTGGTAGVVLGAASTAVGMVGGGGGSGGVEIPEVQNPVDTIVENVGDVGNKILKRATDGVEVGVKAGMDSSTKLFLLAGGAAALFLLTRK